MSPDRLVDIKNLWYWVSKAMVPDKEWGFLEIFNKISVKA